MIMKTICIIITVLVVACALAIYAYVRLVKWTITFDASCVDDDKIGSDAQKLRNLPARDAKGRFIKAVK